MDVLDLRLAAAQRLVLAVVVVLAAVAVWRPMPDPFMLPKMAAVLFGAVVLLSLSAVRALRSSRLTLPGPVALWPAVALTLVLVLATLTADNVGLSTFGQHRRYAGLLPYLAYVVVFLVAARLYVSGQPRGLVRAVVGSFAVVTGYGLLQVAGLDPYTWSSNGLDQTFSTMGNINFAAGYIAATAPVLAAVSLLRGWSPAWRWTAFGLLVLGAVYLLVNGSAQGPVAAAAGLTVVAVAWLQSRRGTSSSLLPKDRRARTAALVAAAGALLAVGLLAARLAPQVVDSLSERRYFWRASLAIFGDNPLLGTGLDSFRDYFPRYRAPEHAVLLGFDNADSPHSLPLSMLVSGGLPLALAYLVFVGVIGWVLVRGLRRAAPERLPVVAAFGGMWVAYQVQSLVSVDVPPLTFLHFLSAGVVVAAVTGTSSLSVPLPLAPAARGSLLPRPGSSARPAVAAGLAVVLLLGLTSAWVTSRPLRADLAAGSARYATDPAGRVEALDKAVRLAPHEGEYRILQGQARLDAGQQDATYESVIAAAELRRGSSRLALGAADFARQRGDAATAASWVEAALERDPSNPQLLEQVAELFRAEGDVARADELTAEAARLRTEHADY